MKGENSVERAERLIRDLDSEIDFLRGCKADAKARQDELRHELYLIGKEIEDIDEQKTDAIYTKLALKEFIRNGGGLDMIV